MNRIYSFFAVALTFVGGSYYFMRRMKYLHNANSSQSSYTVDTKDSYDNVDTIKYHYTYDGTVPITSLYHESLLGYQNLGQIVTNMLEDYMEKNKITTKYLVLRADTWEAVIEFPDKSVDTKYNYTILTTTLTNYKREL